MGRDNNQCVLTKQGIPLLEVAHIIPKKLHKKNRCVDWGLLRIFWGKERVEEWQREISQQPNQPEIINTEQVQNLMTLSTQVPGYWDRCVCAFRPIEVNPERTEMTISFHWLPLRDEGMKAADFVPTDRNPYGRGHQGFDETPGNGNFVVTADKKIITSGYIFTVTTDDPRKKPLPSFALLNLQWHLHRIAAMKGAAEEYDSEIESDGDIISVRSGSRSPVKESLAERLAENLPPPTSRNRSLSPKKIQDLCILEENPGELVE